MFANGGQKVGLVPTRYPGSESDSNPAVRMARLTDWQDVGFDTYFGIGQRLLATDAGEFPLMDIRTIDLNSPEAEDEEASEPADADG